MLCYTGKSRLSGNLITTVMNAYVEGRPRTVSRSGASAASPVT